MNRDEQQQRMDDALDWAVRTNDPDFVQWDAFTAWLERDPRNADAYHDVQAAEIALRDCVPAREPATPSERAPLVAATRRWAPWGGAVAAALAIMLALPSGLSEVATAPGETRTVALADGDAMVMNGDTVVHMAKDRRTIRLDQGQIYLALDSAAAPISVELGALTVVDIGTRFDVTRNGDVARVAVSDGAVRATRGDQELVVRAGERLLATPDALALDPQGGGDAGQWRSGQLTYRDERIAVVAQDLARATGIDISVDKGIADQRFTGTLTVADVREDPASLGQLLGIAITDRGTAWSLQKGH